MNWFSVSLIYLGFFCLIGGAVYLTDSAMPLWALLLIPSFKTNESNENKDENKAHSTGE